MNKQKYLDDIKDIKNIMDRSTKFISLSGLSGISAGVLALVASYIAYRLVYFDQNYLVDRIAVINHKTLIQLLLVAVATKLLAILFGIFFTSKKAKNNGQKMWDAQARRFYINLLIPLITGGLLCLVLLLRGYVSLVAPMTLIFYGLGLINASNHSISDIRSLGIIEIILGLIAVCFVGYGLIFWAIGFGVMHIIYGIVMHYKYGS